MNLLERIFLLSKLGHYILEEGEKLQQVKKSAYTENTWFVPEFVQQASENIARYYLQKDILESWVTSYNLPQENTSPRQIGIVMAGNIPLVGFHDFLSVFITGNISRVKLSSKDEVLLRHLVSKMIEWDHRVIELVHFETMLKGCDAYIATGSNNTSGYFEYYFSKYPHLIRKNRTSVAILSGKETITELTSLADDICLYFGLGCRNVTKIYVPKEYDFEPLLGCFEKYNYFADINKYRNNYDYDLAILILNKNFYMKNEAIILVEDSRLFSPIAQLHWEYYASEYDLKESFATNESIQCIVGAGHTPFGKAQYPKIDEYADGVDTMDFLVKL